MGTMMRDALHTQNCCYTMEADAVASIQGRFWLDLGSFAVERKAVAIMDLSVQHIDIHCDDLERSVKFYTEVLGFTYLFSPTGDKDAPMELVWLRNDNGVVIELTREKANYQAEVTNRASKAHIAFRVPDVDAAITWLRENDVEVECDPVDIDFVFDRTLPEKYRDTFTACDGSVARMRLAFFRGPSGERFEILRDDCV
jgi:catechol 2,3-dioxygenase-like lactoylglutathione lyase family enzyme